MFTSPFGPGPDSSPNNPPIFIMNIIITVAILVIVASPIVNAIRRALLQRYLRQHGIRVDATITQMERAYSNRRLPGFSAVATGIDPTTGKERIFTYRGVQQFPNLKEGHRVIILIDPRKPSRYAFLR